MPKLKPVKKLDAIIDIEVAHIYSDTEFGDEQIQSVKTALGYVENLVDEGYDFTYSAMVDTSREPNFDWEGFYNKVLEHGIKLNLVVEESAVASNLIGLISQIKLANPNSILTERQMPNKVNTYLIDSFGKIKLAESDDTDDNGDDKDTHIRFSCAALTAGWYYARLSGETISVRLLDKTDKERKSPHLVVNFLPRKYAAVDEKTMRILSAIDPKLNGFIKSVFFD